MPSLVPADSPAVFHFIFILFSFWFSSVSVGLFLLIRSRQNKPRKLVAGHGPWAGQSPPKQPREDSMLIDKPYLRHLSASGHFSARKRGCPPSEKKSSARLIARLSISAEISLQKARKLIDNHRAVEKKQKPPAFLQRKHPPTSLKAQPAAIIIIGAEPTSSKLTAASFQASIHPTSASPPHLL